MTPIAGTHPSGDMTTQSLSIAIPPAQHAFTDAQLDAAASLLRHIPRDQALGLRLLALAQTCAASHMTQAALNPECPAADPSERQMLLGRSQASALASSLNSPDRAAQHRGGGVGRS